MWHLWRDIGNWCGWVRSMRGLGTWGCSEVRGALAGVEDCECGRCGVSAMVEVKCVELEDDVIEVVQEFCYLGDDVGGSGDIQSSVAAGVCAGWRGFGEISLVLWGFLSLKLWGRLYESCVGGVGLGVGR